MGGGELFGGPGGISPPLGGGRKGIFPQGGANQPMYVRMMDCCTCLQAVRRRRNGARHDAIGMTDEEEEGEGGLGWPDDARAGSPKGEGAAADGQRLVDDRDLQLSFSRFPSEGHLTEALVKKHTVVHRGVPLVPYVHQVAGHRFSEGKNGSLIDQRGKFYKPLPHGPRGHREVAFYERVYGTSAIAGSAQLWCHSRLREFLPVFFGAVSLVPGAGTGPVRYVVLGDQAFHYTTPSILDVKIGYQTWHPTESSDEHRERCMARDSATTSSRLGFKLCGMQVYVPTTASYWRAGKPACKKLRIEEVEPALRKFVTNGGSLLAADVLTGPRGLIAQLQELHRFFKQQSSYVFYSSSILIMFEGSSARGTDPSVSIRLVDFAHTYSSDAGSALESGAPADTNFIGGLEAFLGFLRRLVDACE